MCSVYNPVCDVAKVLGHVGGKIAGSVFDVVATAFADAADKVTQWMWTVIASTTTVDLSGSWFRSTFGITLTLSGVVIVALFVLELIKAVLRREPTSVGRATIGIGGGVLGAFASIGVVSALLRVTDTLSDGVVRTSGLAGIDRLGHEIAPTAALSTIGAPALMLVLGLGYLVASFFVWALFIMRKAMLIVAAVFAPVAFAGSPTRATGGWVRRWIEFTLALIFSKLVVVILFTLAISLVGSPGKGFAAVGNLFSGLAILLIACFAPWLLFKLVHFVHGDVMHAHHQAATHATLQAGSTPVAMARGGARRIAGVIGGHGSAPSLATTDPHRTFATSMGAGFDAARIAGPEGDSSASDSAADGARPASPAAVLDRSAPRQPPSLTPREAGAHDGRSDPPTGAGR